MTIAASVICSSSEAPTTIDRSHLRGWKKNSKAHNPPQGNSDSNLWGNHGVSRSNQKETIDIHAVDEKHDYFLTMKRVEKEVEDLFDRYRNEDQNEWFTLQDYEEQLLEDRQFLFKYNPSPEEVLTSFNAMDADGDGMVHFAEFYYFIVANLPDLTTINELQKQGGMDGVDWLALVVVSEYLNK